MVAALVVLLGCAIDARSDRPVRAPLVGAGLLVFAVQEHAERYAHSGQLPLLLDDRAFLVGLALQVPVGLVCAALARRLLDVVGAAPPPRPRPAVVAVLLLAWAPPACRRVPRRAPAVLRGRDPPLFVRPS
jgi:hypothetical protein